MQKGVRFRIYPDKEQRKLINQTFGCCRLVYNMGLQARSEGYKNGEKIGFAQTSKMLTELKTQQGYKFLKDVDSVALQQSLRDLDRGFVNFFAKRAKYPCIKSKHDHHQSYRTVNQGAVRIEGKYIRFPKVGYVKIKQSMEIGHINNATIERSPSGKYYVVLNVEFEPVSKPCKGGEIGIDMGIRNFYTDSNGSVAANPKFTERAMRRLAREQRRLSRKQKNSNNRRKQRFKVSLAYEKVANQRNDFLQKLSTKLICENQTICIEDIKVNDLIGKNNKEHVAKKRHNLNRSQYSAGWYMFFEMLKYKALWYGRNLIKVPSDFPSSRLCSDCGFDNTALDDVSIRKWTCPECGSVHDRDVNAARNILHKGLQMQFS